MLDSSVMLQRGCLDVRSGEPRLLAMTWFNRVGEPTYRLNLRLSRVSYSAMTLEVIDTRQKIEMAAAPLRLGGARWYFNCGLCGARSAKLYLPPGCSAFLCRGCYNLTYQSCNTGGRSARYMIGLGARLGIGAAEMRAMLRIERGERPWRRKRDRKPDYSGRVAREEDY